MKKYRKNIKEGTPEYDFYASLGFPPVNEDPDKCPIIIRITIGNMNLIDGFYMPLPDESEQLSIEDTIRNFILGKDQKYRIKLKKELAKYNNPDLCDIYDAIVELYKELDEGKIYIEYNINNGASNIKPSDLVSEHLRTYLHRNKYRLLDIVIDVYNNIDPFRYISEEQKNSMLRDFRSIFILYAMDKFDYQLKSFGTESELENKIKNIINYLNEIGFIETKTGGQAHLLITHKGYDFLKSIINEAEFYIDNYDIFGDIYIKQDGSIEFGTGYGYNLLIPVFKKEGIDPYKALFICSLYLGNMDELLSDISQLFTEEPFRNLFELIAISPREEDIGKEFLEDIINEGKRIIDERRYDQERQINIKKIMHRINNFD